VEHVRRETDGFAVVRRSYARLAESAGQSASWEVGRRILARLAALRRAALQHYLDQEGTGNVGPVLVGDSGEE
jgi:hypothetical protein